MSLTIIYEGQRKKLKVLPSSTINQIIEESSSLFHLNSLKCNLIHNKKIIDKSQLFRFSGLSNNSIVELVLSNSKIIESNYRIALSAEGIGSKTDTFNSNNTLRDVLNHFIQLNFLPNDLFERSPILVYLCQQFLSNQFDTPLQSLGFDATGTRLQLRFDQFSNKINEINEANEIVDFSKSSLSTILQEKNIIERNNNNNNETDSMEVVTPVDHQNLKTELTIQPNEKEKEKENHNLVIENSFQTSQQINHDNHNNNDINDMNFIIPQPSVEKVSDLCHKMLNSNFDCVSSPALITITKYIDNLIRHPQDSKYRVINTNNNIFSENVKGAKGGLEILISIGFLPLIPTYLKPKQMNLSLSSLSSSNVKEDPSKLYFQFEKIIDDIDNDNDNDNIISTTENQISIQLLLSIRNMIVNVHMEELNVPIEKRPAQPLPPSQQKIQEPKEEIPIIPFDPYKPFILRTANQPHPVENSIATPNGVVVIPSNTEKKTESELKLDGLLKEKNQLIGDRSSIQRNTKISYVSHSTKLNESDSKSSNFETKDNNSDNNNGGSNSNSNGNYDDEDNTTDSLAMKYMLKKYALSKKSGDGDDSSPLTTKVMRDLEKIQKEIIYPQTLIKIRFPDRICLEAYFHPQDTIEDINQWLLQTCFNTIQKYSFELYTTPPRTILPLDGILQDLRLVPAAVIYLSWKSSIPSIENNSSEGRGEGEGEEEHLPGYSYLNRDLYFSAHPSLMQVTNEVEVTNTEQDIDINRSNKNQFPVGYKLVRDDKSNNNNNSNNKKDDFEMKGDEKSDSKDRNKSSSTGLKKPKWLKT